jgi:hypothetical protein
MEAFSQQRAARRRAFRALVWAWAVLWCALAPRARAAGEEPTGRERGSVERGSAQFGVALTGEVVADPGDLCPEGATTPCILRSGGGMGIRIGYRSSGPWFAGGAYEFSRHGSSSLLRLAILQQLRAELRYYFEHGNRTTPFLAGGLGLHFYGSDWTADTWGLVGSLGAGVVFELTPRTTIGCVASYRMLVPRKWTDASGQERADGALGFGLAHLVGLEFTFEVRDPVARW